MEPITLLRFVLGLALLFAGAEVLVRGASSLAERFGVSPLVVGLTVVAFGTSSPELGVSIQSALAGRGDLALGNVLGSNVFNVLAVLGLSAIVAPLIVSRQVVRFDVPVMVGVSALVWILAGDGSVGRGEGVLLVVLLAVYLGVLFVLGTRETRRAGTERPAEASNGGRSEPVEGRMNPSFREAPWFHLLAIAVGLALLVLGARWLVEGATAMARQLGVSDLVIGLAVVAAGTSIPEVATSLLASFRGQRDIAVGNVVGSNAFNLLGVLGATAIVAPAGIAVPASVLAFDLPVMTAVAVACLPIFFTGGVIARWEGVLFAAYYVAYVGFLFLDAADHAVTGAYGTVMLLFVVPLTVVTLVVIALREARRRRRGG